MIAKEMSYLFYWITNVYFPQVLLYMEHNIYTKINLLYIGGGGVI